MNTPINPYALYEMTIYVNTPAPRFRSLDFPFIMRIMRYELIHYENFICISISIDANSNSEAPQMRWDRLQRCILAENP